MFVRASAQLRRRRNNLLVQFTGAEAWACGGDIASNLSWRRGDHVCRQCEAWIGIRGFDRGWNWRRGGLNGLRGGEGEHSRNPLRARRRRRGDSTVERPGAHYFVAL